MLKLIRNFADNNNSGLAALRVKEPYRVKVFCGCGSHYGIATELEKESLIYIDKISQSENSNSMFGHVQMMSDVVSGDVIDVHTRNYWVSLASKNLSLESYVTLNKNFLTVGSNTGERLKSTGIEYNF